MSGGEFEPLLDSGRGWLRDHPNPNAIAHPCDFSLRYHGRPPCEPPGHRPLGIVTAHSTEGLHDTTPPDMSAESTRNFLAQGSTSASYHLLVDSDSGYELLPPAWRAWHVARDDSNQLPNWWANTHTYGWAYGGHADRWYDDHVWAQKVIAQSAPYLDAYRVWLERWHGIHLPLRLVSISDIAAGKRGFTEHACWQADRSDNGFSGYPASRINFRPIIDGGWSDLFDALADLERARTGGSSTPEPEPAPEPEDVDMDYVARNELGNKRIMVYPDGRTYLLHSDNENAWAYWNGQIADRGVDVVTIDDDDFERLVSDSRPYGVR